MCKGDTSIIGGNPIATGGMSPYNYTWTPNYNISNVNIDHPSVWPDSTMTYVLSVGDANGRSALDSIKITIGQRPVVTLGNLPDMCSSDDPLKLTQGKPIGGYYISKGIVDSIHFDPFFSGTGSHKVTYHYFDTICLYSDSASSNITVYRSPRVTISPIYDTVCLGDSITFNAHGADAYIWHSDFNINTVSGDSIISAIMDSSGLIQLVGTNTPGACQDSTSMNIVVIDCSVGILGINKETSFNIFPNPARDFININSNSDNRNSDIEILNFLGNVILVQKYPSSLKVDIRSLTGGMYYLRYGNTIVPFIKMD